MNVKIKNLISTGIFSLGCLAMVAFGDKETRNLGDFEGVSVSSGISATLVSGSSNKVDIDAENIDLDKVITEIKDDVLRVKVDQKWWSNLTKSRKRKITVTITYSNELEYISSSAGSSVKSDGTINSDDLELNSSSGSSLKLDVNASDVESDVSSGATMVLSGKAGDLDIDVSSGSSFRGGDLQTEDVTIDASSGASAQVWVTGDLDADVSSGASVRYKGSPNSTDIDKSSGGSVNPMK